jgi:hypothetical protein
MYLIYSYKMPRLPIDYSRTIIYKLVCKDLTIKDCYVGATTEFNKRKNCHKSKSKNENDVDYYTKVYQFIRDNGGWDNWIMVMIEEYSCDNKLQSDAREHYWTETLGANLNSKVQGRTGKIYYEEHKTEINERHKLYREEHKEEIDEYHKKHYEAHKEKILEKHKLYREANRAIIAEKAKIKYTCICGSICKIGNKSIHNKSKKHLKYMDTLNGKKDIPTIE